MRYEMKKTFEMDKKRLTSRVDERLADDLAEFCRRGRAVQEGVIEAAIYWLVHRMPKEEYLDVMEEASAYLDGKPTPDEVSDEERGPKTALGRKLGDVLAGHRRKKRDAAG